MSLLLSNYEKQKIKKWKRKRKQKGGWLNWFNLLMQVEMLLIQEWILSIGLHLVLWRKLLQKSFICQKRIRQFIQLEGKEVQRVDWIIIKNAIEEIYKTTFRLLVNFGKKSIYKWKKNVNKYLKQKV